MERALKNEALPFKVQFMFTVPFILGFDSKEVDK